MGIVVVIGELEISNSPTFRPPLSTPNFVTDFADISDSVVRRFKDNGKEVKEKGRST